MKILMTLVLAVALVTSACGDDDDSIDAGPGGDPDTSGADDTLPDEGTPAAFPFGDVVWQLTAGTVDGDDLQLLDTHPVTIVRTADGVGGTAACNSYGGSFTVTDDTIEFGDLFQTEMACTPDATMTLEAAYLGALGRADTVVVDGDALVLTGDGVELEFSALPQVADAALTGTAWMLDGIVERDAVSSTVAGSEAPLSVGEDGTITGSTGCNTVNGTIVFDDVAWEPADLATTRKACEPDLMAQEAAVLAVLSGGPSWSVDGPLLTLLLDDGRGLVYRAT